MDSDEKGRKTVFDFIQDSLEAKNLGHLRLFSIGRLDRNSMGVLLLTNDGELNQELSHPSKEVEKIYQVTFDRVSYAGYQKNHHMVERTCSQTMK